MHLANDIGAGDSHRLRGSHYSPDTRRKREPRHTPRRTGYARRPTTLLVLYASDFYEIASHIPSLAEAVEAEARRRNEENLNRQTGDGKR